MTELTIGDVTLEERNFLHDLSNQLVIAQGMTSIVLKTLKKDEGIDPKVLDRLEKAVGAVNKQVEMVKDRRTILHSRS
jgi:hypothetical protein